MLGALGVEYRRVPESVSVGPGDRRETLRRGGLRRGAGLGRVGLGRVGLGGVGSIAFLDLTFGVLHLAGVFLGDVGLGCGADHELNRLFASG